MNQRRVGELLAWFALPVMLVLFGLFLAAIDVLMRGH